ncbi:hypothetical protein TUBRATIS_30530 [Tubulinosema ratisbonensis]|uniref:Uncharacterized protein n=1 Tax=Tubulinosema ratisbonensis TaxID=291195 RepID=A0A437AH76_9MICR|nr:hypothetical protein TUBRATIS_30530 [Tubulinosema ratisbonensis]
MRENLGFSEENNQQLEENRNYRFTLSNIIHIVRNLFNPTFLHVFCPLNERKITLILTAMTSVLNIVITILPLLSIPDYFYTNLFIISLFNCILINARNISLFKRAYKHVYFFNCSIVVQNSCFIFCFSYWYLINFYVTDLAFEIIFANGILIFSCRIFFSKTKKHDIN